MTPFLVVGILAALSLKFIFHMLGEDVKEL